MIKQTIKYTNFNDKEVSVDHYFHMPLKDFMALQNEHAGTGGLAEHWFDIIKEGDALKIMSVFETLIDRSFGIRSDDGEEFYQSDDILERFKSSPAYEELLFSLMSDVDRAVEFFKGIMPARIQKLVNENEGASEEMAKRLSSGDISQEEFIESIRKPDISKIVDASNFAENVHGDTQEDKQKEFEKLKRELGMN